MDKLIPMATQLDWLLRLLVAALCGGAIGYERATLRKSAGMRTHIVVAVAAALFMILSKYGFYDLLSTQNIILNPSRIAAQIVTGISFICAGTILVRKQQVSGLTTAAGILATAAIGMAIGAGLYILGVVTTFFLFVIQIIFHDDNFINFIILHVRFNVQIEAKYSATFLDTLKKQLEENEVEQVSIKILNLNSENIVVHVDGVIKNRKDENNIILALEQNPAIEQITYNHGGK